jgi:photosystem II stability/assembly factor-like uncharacterized protein
LLQAGAALGACGLPLGAAAALPAVLSRPALQTPLALRGALLSATRAGPRLLVAGERGTVAYSDDAGKTWAQAQVPARVSITALHFDNPREGWAAGHFGTLLRSSDGGQTWRLVMDGARAAQVLLRDAQDEGQRRAAERKVEEGPDKPFFDLAQAGGKLLAVGAFGLALESADGGASFQHLAGRLPNPRQFHMYGMAAAGSRVFVVGEQGLLMRSADAGASFTAVATPYKGSFFGVLLPADGVVLVYGLRGNVWRSADDGATWAQVANPVPVSISAGMVLADGAVVLVAQNGDVLLSRDQGQNFTRRPAAPPFPAAGVVAAGDGQLVLTGLRGWLRVPLG